MLATDLLDRIPESSSGDEGCPEFSHIKGDALRM